MSALGENSKRVRGTIRYMLPDKYCNRAMNKPWRDAILHLANNLMEHTMRRLLIASSLGLGLLFTGGLISSSFASPVGHLVPRSTDRPALVNPVHNNSYHSHYVPPARHWHRQWHERSQYHRPDGYHYSWR